MKYDEATRTVTMSEREFLALACEQKRIPALVCGYETLNDGRDVDAETMQEIEEGYGHQAFIFEQLFELPMHSMGRDEWSDRMAHLRFEWSKNIGSLARTIVQRIGRHEGVAS